MGFWSGYNLGGAVSQPMGLDGTFEQIRELQRTRLRRYREQAGLSQSQVAAKLGVSQQAVAKWEKENDAPLDVWPRMATLYGMAEQFPGLPFNPGRRRVALDERSRRFARVGARDAGLGRDRPK